MVLPSEDINHTPGAVFHTPGAVFQANSHARGCVPSEFTEVPLRCLVEITGGQRELEEAIRADAFARGFYALQLERVLRHFPASQILVAVSERFRAAPRRELQRWPASGWRVASPASAPRTTAQELISSFWRAASGWREDLQT